MICLSLCLCGFLSFTTPPHLPFFEGPFKEIQAQAEFSHKPFLLYVYQNGCQSCLILEEEVFNHPELIAFIQANFLATKKNLMTYEGIQLSQHIGSPEPGSLLIFDHKSQLLEHIQEVYSAEQLLTLLQFHAGKMPIKPTVVSSPADFEWHPEEEPTHSNSYAKPNERIVHTTPQYDTDPFNDNSRVSHAPSSSYTAKQYDWYESTPSYQEGYVADPQARYLASPSRSRTSASAHTYKHVESTGHKRCYGRTDLYQTVKQLKQRGIKDIQIFPQGRTLQGETLFILRYTKQPNRPGTPSNVRVYRSPIFK